MPVRFDNFNVYMVNKVGHNNAVIRFAQLTGLGRLDSQRNSVVHLGDDKHSVMTACNPYSRMVSMWDARCNRCIFAQNWWGMSFTDFCKRWLKTKNNKATSWFITIDQCIELCRADEILWAEDMGYFLQRLNELCETNVTSNMLGVHYDAMKHRRNWEQHWTPELYELFEPIFASDMIHFNQRNDNR